MRTNVLSIALAGSSAAVAQNASAPGYSGFPDPLASTVAANESLSFGQNYAVLNLDLINGLVAPLASAPIVHANEILCGVLNVSILAVNTFHK